MSPVSPNRNVASALTLCLSMNARKEKSVYNFYLRRLFRIAPLYYFGIVLYLIWGTIIIYHHSGLFQVPSQYSLFGILSNILFIHGFYPKANNNIVPGGWSIATEMSFYIIFPILYSIQSNIGNKKYIQYTSLLVSACLALELIIFKLFDVSPDNNAFIYANIVNQLSVFLIGIYLYRMVIKKSTPNILLTVLGVGLSIASCFVLNVNIFTTGLNRFIVPILSAFSFMLLILNFSNTKIKNNFFTKSLIKIGEMSYSIYILHFIVLDLFVFFYEKNIFHLLDSPECKLLILCISVLTASYCLSIISNRFIERPGIEIGKKIINKMNI